MDLEQLLPARQRGARLVQDRLDSEEVSHLGHPAAHEIGRRGKVLQPESELVPHRIAHDLRFG